MGNRKELGAYQRKARAGLVPFRYDKDGRTFNEGAHHHWRSFVDREGGLLPIGRKMVDVDRNFLRSARGR
jgi:hypothetical protein